MKTEILSYAVYESIPYNYQLRIIGNFFRPKFAQPNGENNFLELTVCSPEALYFCRIRMGGSTALFIRVKTHSYASFVRFLSKAHLHSSSSSKNMASTNSEFLLACLFFPHCLSKRYKQSQQKQIYIGITTSHNGSVA